MIPAWRLQPGLVLHNGSLFRRICDGRLIALIRNPKEPMPALFPDRISEQNVSNVACFIMSSSALMPYFGSCSTLMCSHLLSFHACSML